MELDNVPFQNKAAKTIRSLCVLAFLTKCLIASRKRIELLRFCWRTSSSDKPQQYFILNIHKKRSDYWPDINNVESKPFELSKRFHLRDYFWNQNQTKISWMQDSLPFEELISKACSIKIHNVIDSRKEMGSWSTSKCWTGCKGLDPKLGPRR